MAPPAAAEESQEDTSSDSHSDTSAAEESQEAISSGSDSDTSSAEAEEQVEIKKWPGWPGHNAFRMVVPVAKVGAIIGRKGELIKKMCEETGAKIRILDGALGTSERIVLVSALEDPDAEISPAMDAMLRVFKRVNDISDGEDEDTSAAAKLSICSVRLLVASSQGVSLIGKGGTTIKSIQEESGGTIKVLPGDGLPVYAVNDERVVEIQGDSIKVRKSLELVLGHLRKFLVDQTVIPLYEKITQTTLSGKTATEDRAADPWAEKQPSGKLDLQLGLVEPSLPLKSDYLFRDRESHMDEQFQRPGLSLYGLDPAISGLRSSGLGRNVDAVISQVTQTMQIPLSFAEGIIGIGGTNVAHIRRASGAIVSVQETWGRPDEITVEIKGSSSQVQAAQQLVQESLAGHREPPVRELPVREPPVRDLPVRELPLREYMEPELGYRSSYSTQLGLGGTSYSSSLASLPPYGRYEPYGGYERYRY